ncbi:MAG: peptidylprolyl isomerase, partial [Acidobacteria bacterium]|nr:peptidylprolyl isomerase [Acidobacteriota bacterium]
ALAAALGRLPYTVPADFGRIERTLIELSERHAQDAGAVRDPPLLGIARGFESLFRRLMRQQKSAELGPTGDAVAYLKQVAGDRPRRLALAALVAVARVDAATAKQALAHTDAQVRRLAMVAAGSADQPIARAERLALASAGLNDRDPHVRYEAAVAYGRLLPEASCSPVFRALDDLDDHVALAAIDLLGAGCPERARAASELEVIAGGLSPGRTGDWHRATHALVALARVDPASGSRLLPRFSRSAIWQVRMYAARAAGALKDEAALERLAIDEHDNVRDAAVRALNAVSGHKADRLYVAALRSRDLQLVITAAEALAGTPQPSAAVPALLDALQRVTAERKDTSRDTRLALLERLQELGSREHVAALQPYLSDFDPRIAARAAEILSKWTGTPQAPATTRLELLPAPSVDELGSLPRRARLVMRGGGTLELALFPEEAPVTVARVVRLARAGYYHGLTFHRVVPNFVIQGGSRGANEYVGDARYLRDEVGRLTHARGTVGISTRGRDTGDAQLFINLADNPRLDHQYTVFAEVTRGLDVLVRILEGDVIERMEIW